jgi:hypothetical protein
MGILFCLVPRLGRRRTGDGTSSQKGDGMGMMGTKRMRVGGVGIFTGGGGGLLSGGGEAGEARCLQWSMLMEL